MPIRCTDMKETLSSYMPFSRMLFSVSTESANPSTTVDSSYDRRIAALRDLALRYSETKQALLKASEFTRKLKNKVKREAAVSLTKIQCRTQH